MTLNLRLVRRKPSRQVIASTRNLIICLACWMSCFGSGFATSQAQAAPRYRITDLGTLPDWSDGSGAVGINNLGHVVGFSGKDPLAPGGPFETRAFLWTVEGGMRDLGILSGTSGSAAYDINDRGEVVGDSDLRAFRWTEAAGMQELEFQQAWGVNAAGQIAAVGGSTDRSFRWDSALGLQPLGNLPGRRYSIATDINVSGQLVGSSWEGAPPRAFLWTPGVGMVDLGDLPGGLNSSHAWAVNDSGHAVGISSHALNPLDPTGLIQLHHAFLWTPARGMEDLGVLPGEVDYSDARDINNRGEVVGYSVATISRDPPGPHKAFLWTRAEGMQDLTALLDESGAGWILREALAINDLGQIVGNGLSPAGASRAFLLTPVPEPSGLILVAGALVILAAALLRRARHAKPSG